MPTSLVSTGVTFPDSTTQTTAYLGGAGKAANIQTFNSSGTWTKPSGYGANSRVLIQCWGGGGAGGGSSGGNRGGGGGGGYNYTWVTLSAMGSTETATVGAGGTGTSSLGNSGGDTSLGSLITAYGGGGGNSNGASPCYGGGGGGQISAGMAGNLTNPTAGRPLLMGWPRNYSTGLATNVGFNTIGYMSTIQGNPGGIAGSGYSQFPTNCDAFMHGGGGGSNIYNCASGASTPGGSSVWGGGGGGNANGSVAARAGGTSVFGGAGGSGNNAGVGTAGSAPGGGGGGSQSGSGGAGAAGRIIVTVFDGA